jgi:hypothetical protein
MNTFTTFTFLHVTKPPTNQKIATCNILIRYTFSLMSTNMMAYLVDIQTTDLGTGLKE